MFGSGQIFTRGCSSVGRAPALQAGGQEFEPPQLHQLLYEGKLLLIDLKAFGNFRDFL